MEEIEGIPCSLIELMDELSNEQFLKIASYRLGKINSVTDEELEYVDYIMFKMGEIAKKMRFRKLNAENKMKVLQMVAKEGLDTSVFFTEDMRNEDSEPPPEKISKPPVTHSSSFENKPETSHPSLFPKAVDPSEMLPALNASKPSDKLCTSFQNESKSFNNHQSAFENVFESYETETSKKQVLDDEPPPTHYKSKAANPSSQKKYRDASRSPPRAYRVRSKSRGRSRSRSESPPSRSRSKSRGRYRARSRSRGRYQDRSRAHYGERDYYY